MLYIISEDIGYETGSYEFVYTYDNYRDAQQYAQMCLEQSTEEDDVALFVINNDDSTYELAIAS